MSETVGQEFFYLFVALGSGLFIGFLFDCYRVLRRFLPLGWFLTQLADLIFWVFCAFFVFSMLFLSAGGEINLYTFFFLPLGFCLYLFKLSSTFQPFINSIFKQVSRLFSFFYLVIIHYPFLLVRRGCRFLVLLMVGFIRLFFMPFSFLWGYEVLFLKKFWRSLKQKFSFRKHG